ncbi:MAG: hypothetical protein VB075_11255 [Petrimonas sp.]|uniref:hypothetical protein n=1 Tax=Petrimonas sp. TaxID=2023866 RepID=UPI002B3695A9|nr:hypothetical protein [Petrimonas sp.]MEA5045129.1 hypothetical protein [Petrimonas sp.]
MRINIDPQQYSFSLFVGYPTKRLNLITALNNLINKHRPFAIAILISLTPSVTDPHSSGRQHPSFGFIHNAPLYQGKSFSPFVASFHSSTRFLTIWST